MLHNFLEGIIQERLLEMVHRIILMDMLGIVMMLANLFVLSMFQQDKDSADSYLYLKDNNSHLDTGMFYMSLEGNSIQRDKWYIMRQQLKNLIKNMFLLGMGIVYHALYLRGSNNQAHSFTV
jgi:hypothetical protein